MTDLVRPPSGDVSEQGRRLHQPAWQSGPTSASPDSARSGIHYLFGIAQPGSAGAIAIIRRARKALAAYLYPHSGIMPTQCVDELRIILGVRLTTPLAASASTPRTADDLVLEARSVLWRPGSDWRRVGELLDGQDAQRFASSDLPLSIRFD